MQSSQKSNRGFTIIELLVSMSIFLVIMMIGFNFFLRSQRLTQLAESEAKMQMYARQAMTIITKELRQATDYDEITELDPDDQTPEAKNIIFIRPTQGQTDQFTMVRYWYERDTKGVFSLYRAEKTNGDKPRGIDADFDPDPFTASDRTTYKIRPLIKDASIIDPGEYSYFSQDPDDKREITVQLYTAIYGVKEGSANGEMEVKRVFNIDTKVYARNLNE